MDYFNNENNDNGFITITKINQLDNIPIKHLQMVKLVSNKEEEKYWIDYNDYRISIGNLEDLSKFYASFSYNIESELNKTSNINSKTINIDQNNGIVKLKSGYTHFLTISGNTYFYLPIINDNVNKIEDINVEFAYNGGHIDLGTKYKCTSTSISCRGIYFITYKYSKFLCNWIANISLVSD